MDDKDDKKQRVAEVTEPDGPIDLPVERPHPDGDGISDRAEDEETT